MYVSYMLRYMRNIGWRFRSFAQYSIELSIFSVWVISDYLIWSLVIFYRPEIFIKIGDIEISLACVCLHTELSSQYG